MRELVKSSLGESLPKYPSWRIALVLYKDYFEDFLVKQACPFTADLAVFEKALGSFHVQGGRDIPEAVYEGLDGALSLPWNEDSDKKNHSDRGCPAASKTARQGYERNGGCSRGGEGRSDERHHPAGQRNILITGLRGLAYWRVRLAVAGADEACVAAASSVLRIGRLGLRRGFFLLSSSSLIASAGIRARSFFASTRYSGGRLAPPATS